LSQAYVTLASGGPPPPSPRYGQMKWVPTTRSNATSPKPSHHRKRATMNPAAAPRGAQRRQTRVRSALSARETYPLTVLSPIPIDAAISARLRPWSFSLSTSRTFLIDSRSVIAPVYAMGLRPRGPSVGRYPHWNAPSRARNRRSRAPERAVRWPGIARHVASMSTIVRSARSRSAETRIRQEPLRGARAGVRHQSIRCRGVDRRDQQRELLVRAWPRPVRRRRVRPRDVTAGEAAGGRNVVGSGTPPCRAVSNSSVTLGGRLTRRAAVTREGARRSRSHSCSAPHGCLRQRARRGGQQAGWPTTSQNTWSPAFAPCLRASCWPSPL
jgi:hypothetical protein